MARIFVACMASPAVGQRPGRWMTLIDARSVRRGIHRMLRLWPASRQSDASASNALAWVVLTYGGLPDFGPHPDIDGLLVYLDAVDELGPAFEWYWQQDRYDRVVEAFDAFADSYQGTYPTVDAWARLIGQPTELPVDYDPEAFADEAVTRGDMQSVPTDAGTMHVFWLD